MRVHLFFLVKHPSADVRTPQLKMISGSLMRMIQRIMIFDYGENTFKLSIKVSIVYATCVLIL